MLFSLAQSCVVKSVSLVFVSRVGSSRQPGSISAMKPTNADSHSPGRCTSRLSVPACTGALTSSASTSETLCTEIGKNVVGIAERDRASPISETIRLQKKKEVLVVQACDARDRETGTAAFFQQCIEFGL